MQRFVHCFIERISHEIKQNWLTSIFPLVYSIKSMIQPIGLAKTKEPQPHMVDSNGVVVKIVKLSAYGCGLRFSPMIFPRMIKWL